MSSQRAIARMLTLSAPAAFRAAATDCACPPVFCEFLWCKPEFCDPDLCQQLWRDYDRSEMVKHDLPWWECQPNSGLLNLIGRYLLRTAVPALAGTAHLQIFSSESTAP